MFNTRAGYNKDTRYLFSGKDAELRDEDDNLLSTVESFQAQVTFANAQYQPLGSPLQAEFMTGYGIVLTVTQCIIMSDRFSKDVFDFFVKGRHAPHWTLISVLHGYDDSEERVVFRDCVPTGNLDLYNLTAGDVLKRAWQMHCNQAPDLQKLLTIPE